LVAAVATASRAFRAEGSVLAAFRANPQIESMQRRGRR
jgi:hypothetical protein